MSTELELLQLIDGHGRRHAEQIREMERVPEKPVKRARAKQDVFRRDPPDLPRELPDMRELAEEIEEAQLRDVHAKGVKLRTLRIEGAVLERVQMEEAEFTSVVWKDVRLVGCDLANVRTRRMSLVTGRADRLPDDGLAGGGARVAGRIGGTRRSTMGAIGTRQVSRVRVRGIEVR
ncbi:MAG: hypothetical protein WDO18_01100 [Acidobacteriota bacterium]